MHKIASSDECILWHVHGMCRPFVYAGPTDKVEIILNKRKREIEIDLELPHEPSTLTCFAPLTHADSQQQLAILGTFTCHTN